MRYVSGLREPLKDQLLKELAYPYNNIDGGLSSGEERQIAGLKLDT